MIQRRDERKEGGRYKKNTHTKREKVGREIMKEKRDRKDKAGTACYKGENSIVSNYTVSQSE